MSSNERGDSVEQLLDTPGLAVALESDRFKQFLDQIPIAVAASELHTIEATTIKEARRSEMKRIMERNEKCMRVHLPNCIIYRRKESERKSATEAMVINR